MRYIKYVLFLFICLVLFTGCGRDESDVIKGLSKKIDSLNSYHLSGVLEIINNENTYFYDVDVSYLKDNNFRVSLKNQTNNHEQIILRNSDGVFVLTPSLNKSFKFQSEWPYNNSQSYLLHNIINDVKNDSDIVFETNEDGYIITVKTNYSNNKDLVKQKIYIDKDNNIKLVEVLDDSDNIKMKMTINSIDYNYDYNEDYFKLDNNMSVFSESSDFKNAIDSVLYPMYIPQNTYLSGQDKVSLDNGERIIMTFTGDYPFMLIQETIDYNDDNMLSVSGNPYQLVDTVGVLDETSITWINDGISYYLVSNSLDQNQLVEIANSMATAAIVK
ncbi:MAG: outer membrane lipoprotein carrier protein LolA [Bacilli bacterium]